MFLAPCKLLSLRPNSLDWVLVHVPNAVLNSRSFGLTRRGFGLLSNWRLARGLLGLLALLGGDTPLSRIYVSTLLTTDILANLLLRWRVSIEHTLSHLQK